MLAKKTKFILFILCTLCYSNCAKPAFNIADPKNIHVVQGNLGPELQALFSIHKAVFAITDSDITIKPDQNAINALRSYGHMLARRINLISENIANATTTKTSKHEPFTRKKLLLTPSGGTEIREDMTLQYKLVYDPTHPDSQKEGKRRGYVVYPNIDIVTEMNEMILNSTRLEEIKKLLQRIDPRTAIF